MGKRTKIHITCTVIAMTWTCLYLSQPAGAVGDITYPIDFDSMKNAPLTQSFELISALVYEGKPKYKSRTNAYISNVYERSWNESFKNKKLVITSISIYGIRNNQFKFSFELLEDMHDKRIKLSLLEQVVLNKFRAIFLNKMGQFHSSVKVLDYGLPQALKSGDAELILSYYHHLIHEYTYLAAVDSSFKEKLTALNKACYDFSFESKDSTEIAFQIMRHYSQKTPYKKLLEKKEKAIRYLPPIDKKTVLAHDHVEELFIRSLFDTEHYDEFIRSFNKRPQKILPLNEPSICVMVAKAYLAIGKKDSAVKYVTLAEDIYYSTHDKDYKRTALLLLPEVFAQLGMHENAFKYSIERKKLFNQQIITFNNLSSEVSHFNKEIYSEQFTRQRHKDNNQLLIILASFSILLTIGLISISRTIRKKNLILEFTLEKLEDVNQNLNQANHDLRSFAYANAHDIKNPIHTISGFIELVLSDPDNILTPKSRASFGIIEKNIASVNDVVRSTLEYAKLSNRKNKLQKIPLQNSIQRALHRLKKDIMQNHAEIYVEDNIPDIKGTPELIDEALTELLTNALKFKNPAINPKIEIRCTEDKEYTHVHIIDNGIGIPEEDLKRIFLLFKKAENHTDQEGNGTGLAIVMKIAQIHNGNVSAKNNQDEGLTITLHIPRNSAPSMT